MQMRKTKKLVIDYDKLQILLRLGCDDALIVNTLKLEPIPKTGDDLVDSILESLVDYREFDNWGGKRNRSGRKPKNQLENQDESQVANQESGSLAGREQEQEQEEEEENCLFFNSVNSGIRNTRACNSDIPTIDEFLDYAKEQNELAGVGGFACTPEMADACYNYYTTNGWRRGNDANTPIRDWKAVLREWARTEQKNLAQEKGLATYYDKFYDWWNDKLRLKESELESPGHIKRFTAKSPERQRAFNQRWKETKAFLKQKGQNPTDDEIFDYMTKNVIGFNYINSPWLQGRITSDKYETPFEFNVDFVLRPSTWTKLLENYYVDKKFNMGD